ncbi:MAG: M42 family metallopeptidase [Candidatus Hodarchaeota archaeon]
MDLEISFLEKICNAFGPSGHEIEVTRIVKEYVNKFSDEVFNDKIGSLIFRLGSSGPKIMLAGHIDEIGMLVTGINKKGYLSFTQIGIWWDQSLLTQRVLVRTKKGDTHRGIICAPPPHILNPETKKKVVTKDKMFIDIGCKSKKEVENFGVQIGDPIVPESKFELIKRTQIKKNDKGEETKQPVTLAVSKAFDDRIGLFCITEMMKRLKAENIPHPNRVYGVATVQEEVGRCGAKTAAEKIYPDVGFVLEADIAGDVPGISKLKVPSEMSKGISILAADASMIPNPRLRHFVIDIAKELEINYQDSFVMGGATDAGPIHITGTGCPSLVIGIPTRHIHSHNGILDLGDVEKAIRLLTEVIKRLDQRTIDSFTEI